MKRFPSILVALLGILVGFAFVAWRVTRTPERIYINRGLPQMEREHIARYQFAKQYVTDKTVADIACGSCYGINILREAAALVDGYDKEQFCGNHVIDLEKQAWTKHYDVIVSLETIEHLANPYFFLENARRTGKLLILSTPINDVPGKNPYHKQIFTLDSLSWLLKRHFDSCEFFFQNGEEFNKGPEPQGEYNVVAVCR